MASIGFILGESPFQGESIETLYHMASAALKKQHKVVIFLHFDAVYAPMRNQRPVQESENPGELLEDLLQRGAGVMCNNFDIKTRGIDISKTYIDGVKTGGLPDLAEEMAGMDRLIAL